MGQALDPWGTSPIRLQEIDELAILSAGPNGEFDTADPAALRSGSLPAGDDLLLETPSFLSPSPETVAWWFGEAACYWLACLFGLAGLALARAASARPGAQSRLGLWGLAGSTLVTLGFEQLGLGTRFWESCGVSHPALAPTCLVVLIAAPALLTLALWGCERFLQRSAPASSLA